MSLFFLNKVIISEWARNADGNRSKVFEKNWVYYITPRFLSLIVSVLSKLIEGPTIHAIIQQLFTECLLLAGTVLVRNAELSMCKTSFQTPVLGDSTKV